MESIGDLINKAVNEELETPDLALFKQIGNRITKEPGIVNAFFENILDKLRFEQEKTILHILDLLDYLVNHSTPFFQVNLYGHVNTLIQLSQSSTHSESIRRRCGQSLSAWEGPMVKCVGPSYQELLRKNNLLLTSEQKKILKSKRRLERKYLKLRNEFKIVVESAAMLERNVEIAENPMKLRTEESLRLVVNCREMQKRLIFMIEREQVKEENTFMELLTINDKLAQAIMGYDEFMQTGRKKQEEEAAHPEELGLPMFGMDKVEKEVDDDVINLDMLPSPILQPSEGISNQQSSSVEHPSLDSFLNDLPPSRPGIGEGRTGGGTGLEPEVFPPLQQKEDESILSIIANREGEEPIEEKKTEPVKPPEDDDDDSAGLGVMEFEKLKPDDFFSLN